MSGLWLASYLVLWAVTAAVALTVAALARQIGLIHRRIPPLGARMGNPGPALGERVPAITGTNLNGQPMEFGSERGRATLVTFIAPSCDACRELAPALLSIARSERRSLDVVLVCPRGSDDDIRRFARQTRLDKLPIIVAPEVAEHYRIMSTPYALMIDRFGVLRSKGVVNNVEHLESLLNAMAADHTNADSVARGS